METGYFNYRANVAMGWGERRRFLRHWWQFYSGDPHWVPPYFPALRRALASQYVERLDPQFLHLEALPRPDRWQQQLPGPGHAVLHGIWERPVATAALLAGAQQTTTLLSFLRCVNDEATLQQLLELAAETSGTQNLLGPVAPSPYLGAGVLASHWSETPPLHTPYAPPYLADVLGEVMELVAESHLYHFRLPARADTGAGEVAQLAPARLAGDLLPLFSQIMADAGHFAPPDAAEATFLLDWWGSVLPLHGWLALVNGEPAGFVVYQADGAAWLRRAGGGRYLWQRLWLRLASKRATQGRVLAGGVLPGWQGVGIGRQLLAAALQSATEAGWQKLLVGPVWQASRAEALLAAAGGEARQRYQLFRWQGRSESWW
jgi:GNAT superfamily N-acetyltransferase